MPVIRSTRPPQTRLATFGRFPPYAPPAMSDPMTSTRLTHLQRLEAESIHIMREVVAEAERPVMLYSIGKDSATMLHLAKKAFYPAPPPFPLLHVDTTWKFRAMYRDARTHGPRARHGTAGPPEPRSQGAGHQPFRPRLAGPHRHVEDAGSEAGAGAAWLRRGLRRGPTRRGKVARQGAHLLVPHRPAPLGPEEPAPRTLASVQRAQAQGRVDPGVSDLQLDRARRLAVHPPGEHPDRAVVLCRRKAGRRP